MYKRSAEGWLKHWDFILLDIICLQIAFIIAYFIRQGIGNPYSDPLYSSEAISFILCQIAVIFFSQSYQGILKRGYYIEFTRTVKHVCMVMFLSMAYLFITQQSNDFSRVVFFRCYLRHLILCSQTPLEKTPYTYDGGKRRTFPLYRNFIRCGRICNTVYSPA